MSEPLLEGKSHRIPKRLVWDAWLKVKGNGGAAGVDGVTIEQFGAADGLKDNLFKLWNRMSSGSYFPGPVRAVEIPKKGGTRVLGIPNVVDRVAQTVAVLALEPEVEKVFHPDSYGYRPDRSPLDAIEVCRKRCWEKDWVVDLDVSKFFDSVRWDLALKAVGRHTDQKWILLYVERWLKAPMRMPDGALAARTQGTPQGGPISPLLANLFLHYGMDVWLSREYPGCRFERFADDAVIHCVTERQALEVKERLGVRFADIGLLLYPDKTKIVYCKDGKRRRDCPVTSFTFCGYEFRPREAFDRARKERYTNFLPAPSSEKITEMGRKVSSWKIPRRTTLTLEDIARQVNPVLRGWLAYFTVFYPSRVIPLCRRIDRILMRWARKKYKRLKRSDRRAKNWLRRVRDSAPRLFAHWTLRY
ncbi:group II intron reverse transcriptase/maturase [Nonomuraea angiospora]|uniref:group II intron reverse transcriptase/maturase n=1 Tax=Nonomuraea angiospora TaxID=46172 RepID=UPI00344D89A9